MFELYKSGSILKNQVYGRLFKSSITCTQFSLNQKYNSFWCLWFLNFLCCTCKTSERKISRLANIFLGVFGGKSGSFCCWIGIKWPTKYHRYSKMTIKRLRYFTYTHPHPHPHPMTHIKIKYPESWLERQCNFKLPMFSADGVIVKYKKAATKEISDDLLKRGQGILSNMQVCMLTSLPVPGADLHLADVGNIEWQSPPSKT